MKGRGHGLRLLGITTALLALVTPAAPAQTRPAKRVPILYGTDLFHPHDDPDDHFDLATLFAIPEFDIRGIVLDLGARQMERPGEMPLKQMMRLTGRSVPFAIGLAENLASPEDKATGQGEPYQAGVALILRVLRESKEPVTIFTAGSVRDVAAAFNREPALLRERVGRLYINIGHSGGEGEWNVKLDPHAYVRVMRSGLPVYWVPCFGPNGYNSYWKFRHDQVLETAPLPVQRFFLYALARVPPSRLDPLRAIDGDGPGPTPSDVVSPAERSAIWAQERNMWCTAAFLHAAGREVTGAAERPAAPARIAWFERTRVRLEPDGTTRVDPTGGDLDIMVFRRIEGRRYDEAMTGALRDLLRGLSR